MLSCAWSLVHNLIQIFKKFWRKFIHTNVRPLSQNYRTSGYVGVKGKTLAYFSVIYLNFLGESDETSRKISPDTQPVFQECKQAHSLYKQECQPQNYCAGLPALSSSYLLACHALCRHFPKLPNFPSYLPSTFGGTVFGHRLPCGSVVPRNFPFSLGF
jgi:hypothetical protein